MKYWTLILSIQANGQDLGMFLWFRENVIVVSTDELHSDNLSLILGCQFCGPQTSISEFLNPTLEKKSLGVEPRNPGFKIFSRCFSVLGMHHHILFPVNPLCNDEYLTVAKFFLSCSQLYCCLDNARNAYLFPQRQQSISHPRPTVLPGASAQHRKFKADLLSIRWETVHSLAARDHPRQHGGRF